MGEPAPVLDDGDVNQRTGSVCSQLSAQRLAA